MNPSRLRLLYEKFYKEFRNYIWGFPVVTALAEFEVELFRAFPDIDKCLKKFDTLMRMDEVRSVTRDDEDFKKASDALKELLESKEVKELCVPLEQH